MAYLYRHRCVISAPKIAYKPLILNTKNFCNEVRQIAGRRNFPKIPRYEFGVTGNLFNLISAHQFNPMSITGIKVPPIVNVMRHFGRHFWGSNWGEGGLRQPRRLTNYSNIDD